MENYNNYKGDNMKEQFKTIIYDWAKSNFGESEADDPSWSIEALAEELDKNFIKLYWQQELEYIKEDIEGYLDGAEIDGAKCKLTEKQLYSVADAIQNSDWYGSRIDPEDIRFYVKEELKRGE